MFEWDSVKGYLDCLERNHTATNVAMLVPQVSLGERSKGRRGESLDELIEVRFREI